MIIFTYDGTFEGVLCTVFQSFKMKIVPDSIQIADKPLPLFTIEKYYIETSPEEAERVWKGLEKRLSNTSKTMLSYIWLSELDGIDELLFRYCRKVFEYDNFETDFRDSDVLKLQKIAMKVAHEALYLKQFVRFQKAADGIFFAAVNPIYNALPISLEHFQDRFSDQKWVIYDVNRRYGFYYDLKSVTEVTIDTDHALNEKLDKSVMAEDEALFQELWKGYFKSMTIKERINPRLHRQHLPRRFWRYLTEKQ